MISDEIASAVAPFFDKIGPSHEELRTLVRRAGLQDVDPGARTASPVGKMRRVREILMAAVTDRPGPGAQLVAALIQSVRANGGFRPAIPITLGPAGCRLCRQRFVPRATSWTMMGGCIPCSWKPWKGSR